MTTGKSNALIHAAQTRLQETLAALLPEEGNLQLSEHLTIFRRSHPTELFHGESSLAFCMIAQGAKELFLGDEIFTYDKDHYLITAIQLPTVSHITQATHDMPYLSLKLDLEPATVSNVLLAMSQQALVAESTAAFEVALNDADLIDAAIRLVKVASNDQESVFLAPMITREIIFRLLMGNHSGQLRQIAGLGPTSQRLTSALERLRRDYDQPLHIPEIATETGMSVSSFHDHFKRTTGLTPLQFQKHLRLREARRLLLSEDIDVASVGHRVGYNDSSHFNRDYKKMFGHPPLRDVELLRDAGPLATATS